MTMNVVKSVVKRQPIPQTVYQIVEKSKLQGFDNHIIAECFNEREAKMIASLDTDNAALRARVEELEEALEEIASGRFGKSAAVKAIARAALKAEEK
jgi:hypothetical protein